MDDETKQALKALRHAIWYVNPSGNALYEAGLKRILEPLDELLAGEPIGSRKKQREQLARERPKEQAGRCPPWEEPKRTMPLRRQRR